MSKKINYKGGMVESKTPVSKLIDIAISLFVVFLAFICIVPLWHCLISSISDGKSLMAHEGLVVKPAGSVTMEGYKLTFRDNSIMMGYINTIVIVNV